MADPVQFTNTATSVSHNYYPPTIHLPQYVDNETPAVSIIIQFGFLWAAVLGTALIIICRVRPTASKSDKLAFVWMCLSKFYILLGQIRSFEHKLTDIQKKKAGFIHLFFEAYFVINHKTLAGSQELFGQLWKEYSLSDSRYLTSDAFLVSMESVTAVGSHLSSSSIEFTSY